METDCQEAIELAACQFARENSWEIFSVSRELTSGECGRLLPGRTVSIESDRVRLPTSSTPLAPVNLLLPVPLMKRLAPNSGSSRNRTQDTFLFCSFAAFRKI